MLHLNDHKKGLRRSFRNKLYCCRDYLNWKQILLRTLHRVQADQPRLVQVRQEVRRARAATKQLSRHPFLSFETTATHIRY